jgi:hypothetical protein
MFSRRLWFRMLKQAEPGLSRMNHLARRVEQLVDNKRMPEGKHPDHHHDDTGPHMPHEQKKPYWLRAHKDWKFWVGVVFIIAAIVIYVTTLDLSTVPHPHT